jgi:NADH-quinone oxidoreductase subunit G
MLLVNHPLDCPICDKGGECPLQDNTFRHGAGVSRRTEPKRANAKALPLSELIVLDRERCILCYRCTRFHDEIAGDGALVALERGGTSEIGVLPGTTYDSPFSGNTVELCPVGALTSRQYRFRARPWELETTPSVCCGCSVGCNVRVDARHGSVLRVMGRTNDAIDDGWLCDRGRYASLPFAARSRVRVARPGRAPAALAAATHRRSAAACAVRPGARARSRAAAAPEGRSRVVAVADQRSDAARGPRAARGVRERRDRLRRVRGVAVAGPGQDPRPRRVPACARPRL